ncbi:hypothetical protein D3C83_88710 [compost metagenome]
MGDIFHGQRGELRLAPTEQAAHGGIGPQKPELRGEQRHLRHRLPEGRFQEEFDVGTGNDDHGSNR